MKFSPLDNCRNFVSSRPPLVVFLVCLGMMAIAFVSYAYYIRYHNVYNPDVLHDYNTFLHNVSKLDLCGDPNNKLQISDLSPNVTEILLNHKLGKLRKHSFNMQVSLNIRPPNISHVVDSFVAVVKADMLGYSGKLENTTAVIEFQPTTNGFRLHCDDETSCIYKIDTCASITAQPGVFPNSPIPSACEPRDIFHNSTTPTVLSLEALKPRQSVFNTVVTECKSQLFMKAIYSYNAKLTVILTLERRNTANVHLMRSSYLLFVIIVTILLFGLIVGGKERRHKHTNHYSMVQSGV